MKTLVTLLSAVLITASATQIATAKERHRVRTTEQTQATTQFRNANNSVFAAQPQPYWYSGGYSAPAGR